MIKVSTKTLASLVALLLLGTIAYGQSQDWPLKRTVDLSSGFGDFRANRFHVGIDLRTGGAIGTKIYSPVDGYIWRVKMSYRGYGKGLYVKGDDDHLYIFGHLSRFNKTIQTAVQDHQFERERYYVDIYFPQDSIPVKKGQLIGYSGQTGVGAPHLHFEKRSPDNIPVNPLNSGFKINDKIPPTFKRIGFHLLDDHSLFAGGLRKIFLPVRKVSEREFILDTVLHINSPFGVLAHCYDQKRVGGMRQSIHKLILTIDGVPYYESTLDSIPFEIGPVVNLVFDPMEATNDEKRVRRLYRPTDNDIIKTNAGTIYAGALPGRCAYGLESPARLGKHQAQIVGEDIAGNRSVLTFDFVWVEDGSELSLSTPCKFKDQNEEDFEIIDYNVTEFGLVTEVFQNDSTRYFFFPPHLPTDSRVDLQDLVMMLHKGRLLSDGICVETIGCVAGSELVCDNQVFKAVLPANKLYGARFIGVSAVTTPTGVTAPYASKIYELLPEAFPVRKEFEVSIKLNPGTTTNKQTGLCWYNKKDREWIWIDEETENDDLAAGPSLGGGLFAAIIDTIKPTITKLNLKSGHKYWNKQPHVKCVIEDNLSGFKNDLNIDARVDGNYILPELDTESGEFIGLMHKPLKLGHHELTITVVDQAGNRTEQQVSFDVIKKQ